jgi:very-short-patch-repair endonuclease
MTEQSGTRREELIAASQERWAAALTDLGGRNTLLYYKDRRAGTLDLAAADPEMLDKLLAARPVKLTRLFRDADIRADAIRRVQAIYRKARELAEERGLTASYLAMGMATWGELFLKPAAPVLLRPLTIMPTRARHDDFDLVLDEAAEINPVLLHKLSTVYEVDTREIADGPPGPDMLRLLEKLATAAEVPGFEIVPRRVIGTFTYAKLPMVRDLQNATDLLNDSDVVAAIAGDPQAQAAIATDAGPGPLLDSIPPADDYCVMDADSSQRTAISAVVSGQSLVIHGPPGTGKSQTIANLIASMVARGRKVLFVAEKRAAIDAVLTRLKTAGLAGLVLDIHDGTRDRQRIAADLGATLDLAQQTPPPEVDGLHRRLVDRQQRLTQHVTALHEAHPPWGLTPFQVQSALLGISGQAHTPVRLPAVERITRDTAELLRDELREYAHLGGFSLSPQDTPWCRATIQTAGQAKEALTILARLAAEIYPAAADRIGQACTQTGLRPATSYAEWAGRLALFAGVLETWRKLSPEVYRSEPELLAAATAPRGEGGARHGEGGQPPLRWRERRALANQAKSLWLGDRPQDGELHEALAAAAAQLAEWERLRTDGGLPRVPDGLAQAAGLAGECERQLSALRELVPVGEDAGPELAALAADQDTPWKLPRLRELRDHFREFGLNPLLDWLTSAGADPDLAALAFDHAWYRTILDEIRARDPRYAAHSGAALDEIAEDFRRHDTEHLAANQARVRREVAERLREAQEEHPLQARVVRKQAALRRRHMPLRRLLDQAGDVLFAIKPCWAMSPLVVSQVLPASRLFDVVIFDEASQVTPADAIPSLMRAHQVIVAGDDRQLPPTNFFRQVSDGEGDDAADEDDSLVSFGYGFESILDTLRPLLPTAPLNWHYRSRDERLVAFSNARIYGGALTTFPGVIRDDCLRHVVVPPGSDTGDPVDGEVRAVVDLVLEHARSRPGESLGVIALGIRHAERIDEMLRGVLAANPGLEGFFAEDQPEPFFVKNLERVQGDERDAIILSIGYGKHADGRMRYQWGPLLRQGGERRLNVATTRARNRLTLVSSFSSHDVDPERVTSAGARLLCEFLAYADAGGTATGGPAADGTGLDPFDADIQRRLRESGITVVPRYGVGGYRVDFAAVHPGEPGRMVLAIEADGASYRDSRSARDRDRLRKEHLERLGWSFHRIWSTNWFRDPDAEVEKVRAAYERSVAAGTPAPGADDGNGASAAGVPRAPAGAAGPAGAADRGDPAGPAGPADSAGAASPAGPGDSAGRGDPVDRGGAHRPGGGAGPGGNGAGRASLPPAGPGHEIVLRDPAFPGRLPGDAVERLAGDAVGCLPGDAVGRLAGDAVEQVAGDAVERRPGVPEPRPGGVPEPRAGGATERLAGGRPPSRR